MMKLVSEKQLFDGVQMLYRSENGYGASVVRHMHSYGGSEGFWEVAPLEWEGDAWDLKKVWWWEDIYPLFEDDGVIGDLTWPEVTEVLLQIENLLPRQELA